jgi:hypothetical protein
MCYCFRQSHGARMSSDWAFREGERNFVQCYLRRQHQIIRIEEW